ncbi:MULTISPECIES: DDE-type integrase/transposase/recombinase [Sphingobacterium]|nr:MULTISPECIES: DDE-type integrase/transposase/recombinase [Sphingobacterium]
MVVLTLVKEIRIQMPLLWTRKLLHVLEPRLIEHGIKMGRDQLFNLLRFHGLLIRRRKRIVRTTDSNHIFKRYPNLIKELIITGPEQLWVSDITYIRTVQGFSYLSLITDAYSRKIVGYALHPTLEATGCLRAWRWRYLTGSMCLPSTSSIIRTVGSSTAATSIPKCFNVMESL